jgi:LysM domain
MTVVDPETQTAAPDPGIDLPIAPICPYLISADGAWRSASVARDHRCGAVAPAAPVTAEKQRRLCLVAEHVRCATFEAAEASRPVGRERDALSARPIARTTPVVLDQGRLAIDLPRLLADRGSGQTILIALLGLAFLALMLGRSTGGGIPAIGAQTPGPSAVGATALTPPATPTASPTASPVASPTTAPTPTAAATRTYKVRSGDTLVSIARKFDTTAKKIRRLNGLEAGATLRVGQVLQIP